MKRLQNIVHNWWLQFSFLYKHRWASLFPLYTSFSPFFTSLFPFAHIIFPFCSNTGEHPTTRMCLLALEGLSGPEGPLQGASVMDYGAGRDWHTRTHIHKLTNTHTYFHKHTRLLLNYVGIQYILIWTKSSRILHGPLLCLTRKTPRAFLSCLL
jgi:hypothetical protein